MEVYKKLFSHPLYLTILNSFHLLLQVVQMWVPDNPDLTDLVQNLMKRLGSYFDHNEPWLDHWLLKNNLLILK
jgi:hypothetical protein